jgi:hypothetical protein
VSRLAHRPARWLGFGRDGAAIVRRLNRRQFDRQQDQRRPTRLGRDAPPGQQQSPLPQQRHVGHQLVIVELSTLRQHALEQVAQRRRRPPRLVQYLDPLADRLRRV